MYTYDVIFFTFSLALFVGFAQRKVKRCITNWCNKCSWNCFDVLISERGRQEDSWGAEQLTALEVAVAEEADEQAGQARDGEQNLVGSPAWFGGRHTRREKKKKKLRLQGGRGEESRGVGWLPSSPRLRQPSTAETKLQA